MTSRFQLHDQIALDGLRKNHIGTVGFYPKGSEPQFLLIFHESQFFPLTPIPEDRMGELGALHDKFWATGDTAPWAGKQGATLILREGEITAGNGGLQFRMTCPVLGFKCIWDCKGAWKFRRQALSLSQSKHEEGSWGHHLNWDPLMYVDSMGIFKHEI